MTPDPLDALKGFYDECQAAPVPESLVQPPRTPWWLRLIVPLGGVGVGGALALAILAAPAPSSREIGIKAAQELAYRSLALQAPHPRPQSLNARQLPKVAARRKEGARWSA